MRHQKIVHVGCMILLLGEDAFEHRASRRIAHAEKFRPVDPVRNAAAHTYEWPGFAPWAITEWYQKLRAAFAYLKA